MTLVGATMASVWDDIFHHPDDEAVLDNTLAYVRWMYSSGTGFSDGRGFGKCVPEFAFGMGRSFPLRCFAESASHSGRSKRDTLSQRRSSIASHYSVKKRDAFSQ